MTAKMERIEARIEHNRAERIRYAANLARSSVSSFVVDAATERAERVIVDHAETSVSPEVFEEMLRVLDEPATQVGSLKKAARRSKVGAPYGQKG